jgi:carboxyl-terminal processing protease
LDLRDNDGGTDLAAANIVGLFTQEAFFYETITMYDRRSQGQVEISEVWVQPQELYWDLPVVVLVNDNTVSSGEGIAMGLQSLGIPIMGFSGTAASFGSTGSTTTFPGEWTLTWPAGLSFDVAGDIQLDSDASGVGGVQPDLPIPWTVDNRIAQAADPEGFQIAQAQAWLEAQ